MFWDVENMPVRHGADPITYVQRLRQQVGGHLPVQMFVACHRRNVPASVLAVFAADKAVSSLNI